MSPSAAASLDVLCEDGPVIAVNKPPGIIVQGAPKGVESLADLVRQYLKHKYDKPGNVYLGVPHRIDRPVSGVVVFSRNSKCAARLSEQFAQRKVNKVYRALLEAPPAPEAGTLTDWIYRIPDVSRVEISTEANPDAKHAVLHYRTLWKGKGRALVEIELETGRMHQIRIQFGSRGWPIVGDVQYGARAPWTPALAFRRGDPDDARSNPIALHAWRLTILHPVRYDELPITAPMPKSWKELCGGALPEL
jgi:23S rRNA pseudouridine1911/1915/1917 synthase